MLVLLALLAVTGCAQLNTLKSKVNGSPTTTREAPSAQPDARQQLSFTAIVNKLQLGRYREGEHDLRQYLRQHPGDRPAQAMLRQLVADPEQTLGSRSQPHVVQAGDSYSTLAARYLGDPGAFLILARYNGSTNPSMLRAGETIQLPLSASAASVGDSQLPAPVTESPTAKAERLQRESMSLLDQGQHDQALTRLGEALSIKPGLKPEGLQAAALRKQLLASYHEQAIVLYRDQQLDPAIALWNRILAIDPNYEPAVIYRARALELERRLKQM
ncbi:LysM peptidoglycan-binding domain-containing protein [Rhodanobacter ginsengiterrae]|uniref:LysM peptidoglycan-binding domain-containing protein n=1 Tax=Rhodanobacter ginsengiterrae TaxID=2008451 RepID=UPI003CF4E31F